MPLLAISIQVHIHFSSSKPCIPQFHCQISHHFLFRVCHDVWLPHQLLMRPFALLVPFGAVLLHIMINGRLFVVINTHPPACRLAAVISHSPLRLVWFDTSHTLSSWKSLQSKLPVEESMYWFVKTWLFTTCGGDRSTRHVQELHASTTSLLF